MTFSTSFVSPISCNSGTVMVWPSKTVKESEQAQFVENFRKLFKAASEGNLQVVKQVVASGFTDVDAYSIGLFNQKEGMCLDRVSAIGVASLGNHKTVVDYLKTMSTQPPLGGPRKFDWAHRMAQETMAAYPKWRRENKIPSEEEHLQAGGKPQKIEESDQSILWEKPSAAEFLSSYHVDNIAALKNKGLLILFAHGPMVVKAKLGPHFYSTNPSSLDEMVGSHKVYAWKPGSSRKEGEPGHVVFIGARVKGEREQLYYMLCTSTDVEGRFKLTEDQRIFACSLRSFKEHFVSNV